MGTDELVTGGDVDDPSVDSVSTDEAKITDGWAMGADWIIAPYSNRYIAIDGATGKVEYRSSGTTVDGILQSAINDQNGDPSHFHFANGRRDDPKAFFYGSTVTWDLDSVYISGEGKNKTQHSLEDGTNASMWKFDPSSTGSIYEISWMKFSGNKANNSSGHGIETYNANEIIMAHCEFRDWPQYGFRFYPDVKMDYNKFTETWFLQNDYGGISVDSNGGNIKELDLIGCTLVGGDPGSTVTGNPAVAVPSGAGAEYINIIGGTLKGSDIIRAKGVNKLSITGVQGKDTKGNFTVRAGSGTDTVSELDIKDCQLVADSSSPVTTHIDLQDVSNVDVDNNALLGASNAITTTADSSGVRARDNRGYKRSGRFSGTVSSSGSSVTISHDLDYTPAATDVTASFATAPSGAGAVYCSATSSSDVTLTTVNSPSSDVDVVADIANHTLA